MPFPASGLKIILSTKPKQNKNQNPNRLPKYLSWSLGIAILPRKEGVEDRGRAQLQTAFLMGWFRIQAEWALLALGLAGESPALTKGTEWEVHHPKIKNQGAGVGTSPSASLPWGGELVLQGALKTWGEVCDLSGVQRGHWVGTHTPTQHPKVYQVMCIS